MEKMLRKCSETNSLIYKFLLTLSLVMAVVFSQRSIAVTVSNSCRCRSSKLYVSLDDHLKIFLSILKSKVD